MSEGRGPIESRRKGMLEDVGAPSISSDGQSVAFSTLVHFDVKPVEYWKNVVFVQDLLKQTTTRVADGTSPSLSASGRYVAVSSSWPDLQPYLTVPSPTSSYTTSGRTDRRWPAARTARSGRRETVGRTIPRSSLMAVTSSSSRGLRTCTRRTQIAAATSTCVTLGPPPFERPPAASCAGRRATIIVLPGSSWRFAGTAGQDVVVGSGGSDRIAGGLGRDRICGRGGRDRLVGGPARDYINGGAAADVVKSADNSPDRVDCGPGRDRAIIDPLDRVRRCEHARVRQVNRSG